MIYSVLDFVDKIDKEDLEGLLELITFYYLSEKEKEYFLALMVHCGGKKQRELSVMFEIQQSKLSIKFSSLVKKLQIIGKFLTEIDLSDLLETLKKDLTERQFEVICYLLSGNRQSAIAKHFHFTPTAILYVYRNACRRIRLNPYYKEMFTFFESLHIA